MFVNDSIDMVLGKLLNRVQCSVDQYEICSEHQRHTTLYKTAKAEYDKDKLNLQKVILLPRMSGTKIYAFTGLFFNNSIKDAKFSKP